MGLLQQSKDNIYKMLCKTKSAIEMLALVISYHNQQAFLKLLLFARHYTKHWIQSQWGISPCTQWGLSSDIEKESEQIPRQ